MPDGKPFITKPFGYNFNTNNATEAAISNFFSFKTIQWPTDAVDYDDGLPWIEFKYPQPMHDDWINVSVAQHVTVRMSDVIGSRGRGWSNETGVNDSENYREGSNYQGQWKVATANQAKYTLLTGWNEWIATKMVDNMGTYFMVDDFNEEFSRDVEPMRTGYKDNFYLQTIQNNRVHNYTEAKHYTYSKDTIDINNSDIEQWKNAKTYLDFSGDAIKRDFKGMSLLSENIVNTTNRNDITSVKVTRDDENMYFRITTKEDITEPKLDDNSWMNLLIKTDNGKEMYNGYHYVLNRERTNSTLSISKASSSTKLEKIGDASYMYSGNILMIKVSLKDINLSSTNYHIEFKVTDNISNISNFLNFYDTGDAAPIGRLNYDFGY
jgi:hypothetical protein